MKTILFWDIDGTLLTTGGAGLYAWEEAFQTLTGKSLNLTVKQTAGLSDIHIAINLLKENNLDFGKEITLRLVSLYETLLPEKLHMKSGHVLRNVREILEYLKSVNDVTSILLTGNTALGAKAKLNHYKLNNYFHLGSFAEYGKDRVDIAKQAMRIAKGIDDNLELNRMFVIGDTPHDIHCGHSIGVKVVAVATGIYLMDDLKKYNPWWVTSHLPDPNLFLKRLNE